MSVYEFTFLLNDKEELKNLKAAVDGVEGTVTGEESWGNRHLAYPIRKQLSADFYSWRLELSPSKMSELKRTLRFNDKLLRYLLLKIDQ